MYLPVLNPALAVPPPVGPLYPEFMEVAGGVTLKKMLELPLRVVVMLIEPLMGTVVVSGEAKPLLENVSTITAYAVVCFVIASPAVENELTVVETPVDSCSLFA